MTYREVAFNKMGAAKYYTAVAVSFFCKLILLFLFPFVLVGAFFHAIFEFVENFTKTTNIFKSEWVDALKEFNNLAEEYKKQN